VLAGDAPRSETQSDQFNSTHMRQLSIQGVLLATALLLGLAGCQRADTVPTSAPVPSAASTQTTAAQSAPAAASAPADAVLAASAIHVAGAGTTTAPSKPASPSACQPAQEVLATCAYESTCNAEMTLYLPSAARAQLIDLSKKPGFSSAAFARYCEAACQAKSPHVNADRFAADVCGASAPRAAESRDAKAASASITGIGIALGGGLVVGDEPVPLKAVLQGLGQPLKKSKSRFECDSAFESENTMDYTFANASFEVNGQEAVLRWVRIGPSATVVLPGALGTATSASEETLTSLPGYTKLSLQPGVVRLGVRPGADLSRAFDFKFVNGRLDRVELWVGC
jgi:hypothetical protein